MTFTHNIKTSHDRPPVPTRNHDWSAWFDWASPDDDFFISGNGETEHAAVADLLEKSAEANDPHYHGEVVDMAAAFWGAPKWQPIETAPKDGGIVLTWDGEFQGTSLWDRGNQVWLTEDGRNFTYPTHWMPLPDAPKEGQANGKP